MQKYQNNVQSLDGRAIIGAQVTVTTYPDGAPATVYSSNGSGVITQPILTNGDGEFAFYAANGNYQLSVAGAGITVVQNITDVLLFDPIDADIADKSDLASTSDPAKGASLIGYNVPSANPSPGISVKKWLDSGYVNAGKPSDGMFSSLQDAINEAAVRGRATLFLGNWFISAPLQLPIGTTLLGHGMQSSTINLNNGVNDSAIIVADITPINEYICLRDFGVNGNRANQSTGGNGLIYFQSTQSNGLARLNFSNIHVRQAKGDGLVVSDFQRGSQFSDIEIYFAEGNGLVIQASDCEWTNIDVGQTGLAGVLVDRTATLSNIKTWMAGFMTDAVNGHGFRFRNAPIIGSSLWAQDCPGTAFFFDGTGGRTVESANIQGVSENCGLGVNIFNASGNNINVTCRDRAGAGLPTHSRCVRMSGTSTSNDVSVNNRTATFATDPNATNMTANRLHITSRNTNVITYSGSLNPNPQVTEIVRMTPITGALSITDMSGGYEGLEFEFQLQQDGTGGRTITFGASYITNWTPSLSANKEDRIRFRYNGSKWVQLWAATGLAV